VDNIPGARSLALSPSGVLYVGTRDQGKVYAVLSQSGSQAKQVKVIAEKLRMPNGVAFRDDALYVAEIHRLLKFPQIEKSLEKPPAPTVVSDQYPRDEAHGWKFIAFGPDGKLYVPVGAPCNVCLPPKPIYASITRLNPDGTGMEIFAHGVRNTVGFDWHPQTRELWFTDNGRDMAGDDFPPDELNHAAQPGMHFGFPFCHGHGRPDPQFNQGKDCSTYTPPKLDLGPHVAALGMRFYTGRMFPEKYQGGIFIAEHGSWNRSVPIGYRVMFVPMANHQPAGYEAFAEGWLSALEVRGRPVDVLVMPDGALLISDDKAGRIYRISYTR
jgi:glucose/arabinose dehydrogenase